MDVEKNGGIDMTLQLMKDDLASLKACEKEKEGSRVIVRKQMVPEVGKVLTMCGLTQEEIEYCERWLVMDQCAGMSESVRYSHWMLEKLPLPDKMGVFDRQTFWDYEMGGAYGGTQFLYECMHVRERCEKSQPQSMLEAIGKKVADWFVDFATKNMLAPGEVAQYLRKKSDGKKGEVRNVRLSDVWNQMMSLSMVVHFRGFRDSFGPEDVYDKMSEQEKSLIEVDVWGKDDETLAKLVKAKWQGIGRCTYCGVYGSGMGWGYGGDRSGMSSTSCPRCMFGKEPRLKGRKQDEGPTLLEHGTAAYQYAVEHGMVWDEFLEWVEGKPFDASKKKLCPRYEKCPTICAEEQRTGVRKWPLGSSDFEKGCRAWERMVALENGETNEVFDARKKAEFEKFLKTDKKEKAKQRKLAREQALVSGEVKQVAPAAKVKEKAAVADVKGKVVVVDEEAVEDKPAIDTQMPLFG